MPSTNATIRSRRRGLRPERRTPRGIAALPPSSIVEGSDQERCARRWDRFFRPGRCDLGDSGRTTRGLAATRRRATRTDPLRPRRPPDLRSRRQNQRVRRGIAQVAPGTRPRLTDSRILGHALKVAYRNDARQLRRSAHPRTQLHRIGLGATYKKQRSTRRAHQSSLTSRRNRGEQRRLVTFCTGDVILPYYPGWAQSRGAHAICDVSSRGAQW